MSTKVASVAIVLVVAACSAKPPAPPATATTAAATPPPAATPPVDTVTKDNVSNVAISEDIRKACALSHSEALFSYDSSTVRDGDKAILKKLADCFTTGALKGRQMRLVGHADPRGDQDYNYVLGQHRADNVKSAIVGAGMSSGSVSTTSRGENDATGSSEIGWTKDRRVDVILGS